MDGEKLTVGNLKTLTNYVPLPYRRVSFQPYEGEMTGTALTDHLLSREVYRRSDIMILHHSDGAMAVAAIQRRDGEGLFTTIEKIEILALPEQCVFIESPGTDPANRSALAKAALEHGVTAEQTAIVLGAYDHINIIHRPDPLFVNVIEVTPPDPPKLFHMAQKVLEYADLPPIILSLTPLNIREMADGISPECYLVPCRSGGLEALNAPVYFLDERPKDRRNWTMIGCERSLQFHRHYYGDEPPRIEMCPRRLANGIKGACLLKCCLLEFDFELDGQQAVVPWGADLAMVEQALTELCRGFHHV